MSVRDDAAAAVVGPLGDDHVAVGVELDAVGHAAGRAEDRRLAGLRDRTSRCARPRSRRFLSLGDVREGDVAEVDHAVRRDGDALGQHQAAVEDLFELGVRRDDVSCPLAAEVHGHGEQDQGEKPAVRRFALRELIDVVPFCWSTRCRSLPTAPSTRGRGHFLPSPPGERGRG